MPDALDIIHATSMWKAAPGVCPACQNEMPLEVCKSQAGYYIGQWCHQPECPEPGPYARYSHYFPTRKIAEVVLERRDFEVRTNP